MRVFELDSITAGYGGAPVFEGLSMSVDEGDFISLIGPNGAGKSTLLKVLDGTLCPDSGSLFFRGRLYREYRHRVLAREFSVVHQAGEEMAPFSAYEYIRLARFPHQGVLEIENETDRDVIGWAAGVTGIQDLLQRPLADLSGGELQLVRIAHALAQNSRIILLDEPISHLDIRHSIMIMDILHRLNRDGATILTVLHDINIASDYSSRIIGMKKGKLFLDGDPDRVLRYDLVEQLFGTPCIVLKNPTTGRPFVYPVPGYVGGR
jgi:iron complex transport system ATP-binding protein